MTVPKPGKPFRGTTIATIVAICLLLVVVFYIGFEYSAPNQGSLIVPGGAPRP